MKTWNFQVKGSLEEISTKLQSSLGGGNRFVLNINCDKTNLANFKIRKRVLVAFGTNSQDHIIVNGKMFKADTANETNVEISFTRHPLMKLLFYGHVILVLGFLAGVIFEISSNSYIFIVGGILLATGVLFRLHHKKEFGKNVQEYRTLISKILEIEKGTTFGTTV